MDSFGYIYKITNKINGKCYIGQTKNHVNKRFQEHKRVSKNKNSSIYDYPLYRAFRKYGIENFSFEEIEKCNLDDLDERENYWINYFDSLCNGYNQIPGGYGGNRIVLDEKEVIKKYDTLKVVSNVAKYFKCSPQVIEHILNKNNIKIYSSKEVIKMECKDVFQYDEKHNLVNTFHSFTEAGQWLIDNHISNAKSDLNAGHCIRRLLLRGHNFLYNYYWECKPEFTNEEKDTYIKRVKKANQKRNYEICYNLCFCGNRKSINSTYCKSCENKLRQQNGIQNREEKYGITRETLKQKIRTTPFTELSKKYGVSDNAIRKWCKYYNLPYRASEIKKYSDEEWETL